MRTILAAPAPAPEHPEWCHLHDHEADVCLGDTIHLDFRADNRTAGMAAWANAGMGYCPEQGIDVFVEFPGLGAAYLAPEDVRRLGVALLGLWATAVRGGAR